MRICNKKQFYRCWHAGTLGNRPRTWASSDELAQSGYTGLVTMRTTGGAGGVTKYRLSVESALFWGAQTPGATFNESMPDDLLLLQGEVMRSPRGLELTWSTEPGLKMNEAMKRSTRTCGVAARTRLDVLWPASQEELFELLDRYPDAVVEFSAYDRAVGIEPNRNTIIWEVRDY